MILVSFSVFSRERKYVLHTTSKGNKSFPRWQFQVVVDCSKLANDYLYSLSWKQQVTFSACDGEQNFLASGRGTAENDTPFPVFISVGSMSCYLQSATGGHFQ
jgi:hypothetical protein